jgi:hypothetical protein
MIRKTVLPALMVAASLASAQEAPLACQGLRVAKDPTIGAEIPTRCFPGSFQMAATASVSFNEKGKVSSVEIENISGLSPGEQRCAQSYLKSLWKGAKYEGPATSCTASFPFRLARQEG